MALSAACSAMRTQEEAVENALSLGILVPRTIPLLSAVAVTDCRYTHCDDSHDWFCDLRTDTFFSVPFLAPDRHRHLLREFDRTAAVLAAKTRWNGLCRVSVAQHGVMHARKAAQPSKPYGLTHDNEEADVGDMITPLKREMRRLDVWDIIEHNIILPMRERQARMAGLQWPWPADVQAEVETIDERLKATEARDQVDVSLLDIPFRERAEPYSEHLDVWSETEARAAFISACVELLPSLQGAAIDDCDASCNGSSRAIA